MLEMLEMEIFITITSETSKTDIDSIYGRFIEFWRRTSKHSEEKYKIIIKTNDCTLIKVKLLAGRLIETEQFDVKIVEIDKEKNDQTVNFIDLREINLNDLKNINLNHFDKNKKIKLADKYRSSEKMKKMSSLLNQNGFYNIEYLEESIIQ